MQLLAQERWSREIVRYLQIKVSKLLVIIMRCWICHHILFRWDPEWEDLNVINCGDEEYPLKRDNHWTFDRMFVNCINNTRVVTGKMDFSPSPYFMPKQKGMKNCEHLLPINLLRLVSRWNSFREN